MRSPRPCTTICWSSPTTAATASGTRCCARRCSPTCCRASACGCTRSIAAYLAATPGAGTAAERAHHARESNDLPGAFSASLEAAADACTGRRARRAAACTWRRRSRCGRRCPTPPSGAGRDQVGAAAGDGRSGADGGGAAPGGRAAALGARGARAGRRPGGAGAGALHARPGHGPGRGRRRSPPRERRGAGPGAGRPAVGGAHLGGGHPRPDELRRRAAWRRRDAAADEALAAADALGLDSAWSDTAVSQVRRAAERRPGRGAARLDEALAARAPVRRRRRGDAGPVQPGHRRVRGRPDRGGPRPGRGGPPAGPATSASSGRSTPPSCGTCR